MYLNIEKKYKIEVIRSPVLLVHTSIKKRGIQEYEDIVVGAISYTLDELKEMRIYSWAFVGLQNLGILEYISIYYNQTYNLPFMEFYEKFIEFCCKHESVFAEEYKKIVKYVNDGYAGRGWDHIDLTLGDIIWPIEEASWLRLASSNQKLIDGIHLFLNYLENDLSLKTTTKILDDLIKFQIFLLTTPSTNNVKTENFEHDWKTFFLDNVKLIQTEKNYYFKNPVIKSDFKQWCRDTIWFGRRSKKFKCSPEQLEENNPQIEIS